MINVDIWITDRYNRWNYKIRQNLKNGERSGMINYCRQERLENFVYSELYRLYKKHNLKGYKPCCSIYDNYELDFMLVDRNDRKYGIEVKSNNKLSENKIQRGMKKEVVKTL